MNEYDEQAQMFLNSSGTEIQIRKTGVVEGFPFEKNDRNPHDRYSVTLIRGEKMYKFPFYNSTDAHWKGKKAKPYDVLSCLQTYEVSDDMWMFADEYGYEIHCKEDYERVKNIWKACRTQYRKLLDLFGPYYLERLSEIS